MVWIFALGVLYFMLIHEGFRRVMYWIGGISALLFLGVFVAVVIH